jgi:hypothetical protein
MNAVPVTYMIRDWKFWYGSPLLVLMVWIEWGGNSFWRACITAVPTPVDAEEAVLLLPFCDVSVAWLPVLTTGLADCVGDATGVPAATG